MADTYLGGHALSAPKVIPAGDLPFLADGEVLVSPVDAGTPDAGLLDMITHWYGRATHLAFCTADPGKTGANEQAGSRIAISVAYSGIELVVNGDTNGNVDVGGFTATHFTLWETI